MGEVIRLFEYDEADREFNEFPCTESPPRLRKRSWLFVAWVLISTFVADTFANLKRTRGATGVREW